MNLLRTLRVLSLVTLAAASLSACAPAAGDGLSVDNVDSRDVVVRFGSDWSESVTGTPAAGVPLRIDYDAARLTCRHTLSGRPAWTISVHYRLNGGAVQTQLLHGHESFPGQTNPVITPREAGTLEMWFENTSVSGCQQWDSDFGANYRFEVAPAPRAPGWVGDAAVVISRNTCDGGACDADRRPLEDGFRYDTWARQRALVRSAFFDVWKQGVTDFDNPDLWRQLDVQVHYRYDAAAAWQTRYVSFGRRVGNNARYDLLLRELDPLGGSTRTTPEQCPAAPLERDATGMYVRTTMEFYFTVNGTALRGRAGEPFRGVYEDYASLYAPCAVR